MLVLLFSNSLCKYYLGLFNFYRRIIILVKAGAPVDATIKSLLPLLEEGDIIIDGGNEWYVLLIHK